AVDPAALIGAADLDPAAGRMLRAVRRDGGRLLLEVHHLAVDAVSWPLLRAGLAGEPVAAPGTSFREWAHALERAARERAGELEYWQAVLDGPPVLLGDVALGSSDTLGTLELRTVRVPVPALPAPRVNLQDVLLAGLALAAGGDVLVELEGHGREEQLLPGADLSGTVGWFTTVRPVRLAATDPRTALRRVRAQLRAAPDGGIGYGLLRHRNPETAAALAGRPRPPVLFNYLGRQDGEGLGGDAGDDLPVRHALSIEASIVDGALVIAAAYPRGAVAGDTVRGLLDRWAAALPALADTDALTPSDVLAAVGQGELDELAGRYPGLADVLPLTPLQEGLFYLHQLDPAGYAVQQLLDLDGQPPGSSGSSHG
ncbi:condensation domain-containing protein, partial [Dactylosporangium sp. NPDC051485]|uniref:condensation domain-containing protein n=1 Tax=Dactylosporangium sp. NPDC051485 TaxID=3154846 RepID=UPI00343308B6